MMSAMSPADQPDSAAGAAPATLRTPPPRQPRQWTSDALLEGGREALIEHAGFVYRLRLTASGKLILTK
jgi:hemin uptake protein HemP